MRKLAHISDLHFGKVDLPVVESLLEDFEILKPDLIIISGDLTQRGRESQYREARLFLDSLKSKYMVVPGNHDIKLFDLLSRFVTPLSFYKEYITGDLTPFYEDEEIAVLGINSARSFTWKNGRISMNQIESIEQFLCPVTNDKVKILFTHHPFIPPPGDVGIQLVGRSAKALNVIDKCGIDILLAGHLHIGYSGDVKTFHPGRRSIISVHAGTATSIRRRHEPNGYNFIEIDNDALNINVRSWSNGAFANQMNTQYRYENNEWVLQQTETKT